jgi:hypothetical protein
MGRAEHWLGWSLAVLGMGQNWVGLDIGTGCAGYWIGMGWARNELGFDWDELGMDWTLAGHGLVWIWDWPAMACAGFGMIWQCMG